ncbi:molybdopterin cofactor-binding domain-containing protein [Fodinicola acaciae]|uniref:molybdopterin cofactor-binding domain-containing protein n=1 Tax=Fodinicola acaciae TaxID=2681555 RepID=UPI0013D42ABF|nr:molybdopterin cofactor-binding domain-containing protein [Fodinicola acaciae]
MADDRRHHPQHADPAGLRRRKVLGYLVAAPTLVVAAGIGTETIVNRQAEAAIPSPPQPAELLDLGDALTLAATPTSGLISMHMSEDGVANFEVPRAEVGQGICTTMAMLIAEELDMPLSKVNCTPAPARPELLFNQLTGGSNSVRSLYTPVRTMAAVAKAQLMATAAKKLGVPTSELTVKAGVVHHRKSGRTVSYGKLSAAAAVQKNQKMSVQLKDASEFTIVGTPQNRIDAHDIVTGKKTFTMDLQVPGALPTMVCRPPTISAKVKSVQNLAKVKAMPGVTDVVTISTGVAVRAKTFSHCIDAVRALKVTWTAGVVDGESDATVLQKLKDATLPMTVPGLLVKHIDAEFSFPFNSNSALETNCAIADVRPDRAEIWSGLKTPIDVHEEIAAKVGLPVTAVKTHVMHGGGSNGRKLFGDAALEAAEISKKIGKPVKLMWHRTDDFRHGRTHPMSFSRIRATYAAGNVVSYEQRHTSVRTDFTHGLGEALTATAAKLPVGGNLSFAQTVFMLSQAVPYNFGVTTQLLNEVDLGFHTGSMRNVYSPNVTTARELVVDQLAAKLGKDAVAFRREFMKKAEFRAVLDKVASEGDWGRKLPAGMAQGIGFHSEYASCVAMLVEIDCRPETVNRPIRDGVTGPRITRATIAVDAGIPINPRGLDAQMMGCLNDGIAHALTSSLHIKDGLPLEGSWDHYFYTRQWNTPPKMKIFVMPRRGDRIGGAGELGVSAAFAAVACAYARATGTMPTTFPINHSKLGFEPLPRVPSIPASPTDGLDHAF